MHLLKPTFVSVRQAGAGFRLIVAAHLSFFFILSVSRASLAATETKTFVAFSMKAAQADVENAVKSGEDFRKTQLDLYQLGEITKPWAIVLDKENDDWIIVGERDPESSILTLDDLAVALRARFLHPGDNDPGVTIDPQPLDPSAKGGSPLDIAAFQKVRFFAGVENTHFGKVCFDADWLLKRVSLGLEKLNVEGMQSYYDLLAQTRSGADLARANVACRFWFLPIVNRVNVLGDVVLLEKFKMGVFTQVMYAEIDGKPVADLDHFENSASEGFSRLLSDHYDAAAKTSEVLQTLRGLTRLAALSQGLMQADAKPDLDFWLQQFSVAKEDTPQQTDVLSVTNHPQAWRLSGGVQLAALVARFRGGDAQSLKQLILKTRPNVGSLTWRFDIELKDGQPIFVVLHNPLPVSDDAKTDDAIRFIAHAYFLSDQKRYDDALDCVKKVSEIAPDLKEAFSNCRANIVLQRDFQLLRATDAGDVASAKSLIADGARVTARASDGATALSIAAQNGQSELAGDLLDNGADPNAIRIDGATPAFLAAKNGHAETLKLLLERQALVDIPTDRGATALWVAAQEGQTECLKLLLGAHADVNVKATDGSTPLMVSAETGHLPVVQLLLKSGADAKAQRKNGTTALFAAAEFGHADIATLLLANGADVNAKTDKNASAIHVASEKGNTDVVKVLIASGADLNVQNVQGATALMLACLRDHPEVVGLLLAGGADANVSTSNGNTALMAAAQVGDAEVVQQLLQKKAKVDGKANNGVTALFLAALQGHMPVAKLLISAGADVNAGATDGTTILAIASRRGHTDIVDLLRAAGAKE